jgi:hypothetical protein
MTATDRTALLEACEIAFASMRAARGSHSLIPAITQVCQALADLAVDYPQVEWNDQAITETRAILARYKVLRRLAQDLHRIG